VYAGDLALSDDDRIAEALRPESCARCKGAGYVIRRKAGASILDDQGRVESCTTCSARRRQVSYERIGIKAIRTLADWIDDPAMAPAKKAVDELLAGKRWAAMISAGTGRGKTHLAIAAVHAWVQAGRGNALFRTAPDLFEELRSSYDPANSHTINGLVDLFESRDLLVIDDLGSEYHKPQASGVDWVDEKLFRIIDARYQRKRRTLITTNLRPTSERIPARIRSRLAGCEIVIDGGSDFRRAEMERMI